jgi:hypothetical protein
MEDTQFKDKTTEWRGYTLRALEDINKELNEIKEELKSSNIKMDELNTRLAVAQDKLNNRITTIKVQVAAIGGTAGIISSVLLFLLTKI